MAGWTKMVSMELDDEDKVDYAIPQETPKYPYGLRICLCTQQLKALGLKADCEVGDVIDLRAFARVTSVSSNETQGGTEDRVELQIEELSIENEMDEDE